MPITPDLKVIICFLLSGGRFLGLCKYERHKAHQCVQNEHCSYYRLDKHHILEKWQRHLHLCGAGHGLLGGYGAYDKGKCECRITREEGELQEAYGLHQCNYIQHCRESIHGHKEAVGLGRHRLHIACDAEAGGGCINAEQGLCRVWYLLVLCVPYGDKHQQSQKCDKAEPEGDLAYALLLKCRRGDGSDRYANVNYIIKIEFILQITFQITIFCY